MTGYVYFDQAVVGLFVVVCWVLAHQMASKTGFGVRAIAAGYSLAGFAAFASIVFHFDPDIRPATRLAGAVAHTAVTVTLVMVSVRIAWRNHQTGN